MHNINLCIYEYAILVFNRVYLCQRLKTKCNILSLRKTFFYVLKNKKINALKKIMTQYKYLFIFLQALK